MSGSTESDESRIFYVDRLLFSRVLSCCNNDRERLLLALARFGGLRMPSEIRHMRHSDITDTIIRIHPDTKTGAREVPYLSEIREIYERLLTGLLIKPSPSDYIFTETDRGKSGPARILEQALKKSGIVRWPKLYINLRSSCITDFETIGYTEKAMDSMFGNSARVRQKYYVQLRKDAEYRRILEDNKRLSAYLSYRKEEGVETVIEPSELREFVIAQRIATTSRSR